MTENRFLSFVLTEGIVLMALGLAMLMLPKITSLTFGLMLCIAFIIYGAYKTINSILTRHYSRHFLLNVIIGLLLICIGVILLMAPMFNLVLITAAVGVYFLLESISSVAFGIQTRQTLPFWWINLILAGLQFILGIMIILGLPGTALWVVGILAGINFLFAGMAFISMFIASKYVF